MNAGTFERLEAAFDQALPLDAAGREAFVSRLRGEDSEVAQTLDKMLSLDTTGIENRIRDLAEQAAGLADDAPRRNIGAYRVLGTIGEGGFGVVYLAEQPSPVHRLVAIKVIKPGMDTRHVLARFNDERQALAMMDHAAVVAAIDAGSTDDGRPYVVMPLVPGLPITQFCIEQRVPVRERLELLVDVCRSVPAGDTTSTARSMSLLKRVGAACGGVHFPMDVAAGMRARGLNPGAPKQIVSEATRLGMDGVTHALIPVLRDAGLIA